MTIAVPGATSQSLGLPDNAAKGGVWIMDAGTSTAHLMTPETLTTTHYFIDHAWNWGHGDSELREVMHQGLFAAFVEDVKGLTLVEATLAARDGDPEFFEISVGADAAAVAMRRHIFKRSVEERATAQGSCGQA